MSFYKGRSTDTCGRTIFDIWSFNTYQLENVHNYIQWLFPLNAGSKFNPAAPILSNHDIEAFKSDVQLRQNVLKSFTVILNFYGFEFTDSTVNCYITFGSDYEIKKRNWITPHNHNFLRITRILKFLKLTGHQRLLNSFYNALQQVHDEAKDIIGSSFQFWKSAYES